MSNRWKGHHHLGTTQNGAVIDNGDFLCHVRSPRFPIWKSFTHDEGADNSTVMADIVLCPSPLFDKASGWKVLPPQIAFHCPQDCKDRICHPSYIQLPL